MGGTNQTMNDGDDEHIPRGGLNEVGWGTTRGRMFMLTRAIISLPPGTDMELGVGTVRRKNVIRIEYVMIKFALILSFSSGKINQLR